MFRLLPNPAPETRPQQRREIKFHVPMMDSGKVRSILRTNCRAVSYERESSMVTSVYFDDDQLGSYRESIDGAGRRRKLRLRWYDAGDEAGRLFFEVKTREYELIGKNRIALQASEPLASRTYRELLRALDEVLPSAVRELLVARSRPTVVTRYRREYFVDKEGALRVTVDSELEWFDQTGRKRPTCKFGVTLPRTAVIEGKVPVGPPGEDWRLPSLLYPLRLRPSRFSKYVLGCQRLGLAPDTRGGV